jgi:hypothetical protein
LGSFQLYPTLAELCDVLPPPNLEAIPCVRS